MSGYCNRCGRPWNTQEQAWCAACHAIVCDGLRQRADVVCAGTVFPDIHTCTLHVFFIHLEETEEMLQRLRSDTATPLDSTARSKIGKTPLRKITPIDSTANKVVAK